MFERLMAQLCAGETPLYLAPQAGVSESPFRRLCRRFGADVVVSEFVSAEGLRRGSERTHAYLRFAPEERPIGVQIFGGDPVAMAEAAVLVAVVDALDIPVIGNGDVASGADAVRMRELTGCAGIMIARASHGAPWIFAQTRAALDGLPIPPEPDVAERFAIVLEHARNAIA